MRHDVNAHGQQHVCHAHLVLFTLTLHVRHLSPFAALRPISWATRPWSDYSIQLYKKRNESSFHSGFGSAARNSTLVSDQRCACTLVAGQRARPL